MVNFDIGGNRRFPTTLADDQSAPVDKDNDVRAGGKRSFPNVLESEKLSPILDGVNLDEFDEVLNSIPNTVDSLPEPPEAIKNTKEFKKQEKNWKKKLLASYTTNRVKEILRLKDNYNRSKSEIEKDFIYKPKIMERLGKFILHRSYLRIMIIMPNGVMKEFNKPIKTSYVKVMKGRYVIQLSAMIKYRGKNTLYYHHGNPFPITFDSDKFPYIVNAESLENMFNSNVVSQIFAGLTFGQAAMYGFGMFAGIALIVMAGLVFGPDAVKTATAPIFLIWRYRKW